MLDFDIARKISRAYEEKLVEAHLRVAYAIPSHREFLRGGTPSEPLLAEAAALILNDNNRFQYDAPDMLAKLIERGLLTGEERGEMVGRLLWTIAHDLVIHAHKSGYYDPHNLMYHRPILLLDWLLALINPRWHNNILNAQPIGDPGGLALKHAFKDVYLNFSHFAKAGDHGAIHTDIQWTPLVRGMGYQCSGNQNMASIFVPAHHGGLDAPIGPDCTAPVCGQIQNGTQVTDVLNPHAGGAPINKLPILSLVHDVGLGEPNVYAHPPIPANEWRGATRTENIHVRHYQIHIEGCTHETYSVVPPEKSPVYKSILCATKIINDFPRMESEPHRQAMLRLKPAFFSSEPSSSLEWINGNPSSFLTSDEDPSPGMSKGKRKGHPDATSVPFPSVIEPSQVRLVDPTMV
jgi:hypothetical protein